MSSNRWAKPNNKFKKSKSNARPGKKTHHENTPEQVDQCTTTSSKAKKQDLTPEGYLIMNKSFNK